MGVSGCFDALAKKNKKTSVDDYGDDYGLRVVEIVRRTRQPEQGKDRLTLTATRTVDE